MQYTIEQITYAPESPGAGTPTEAQKKLPQIGHAQGLCYAFDSLYVVVNSRSRFHGHNWAGVFRLLDEDGDDDGQDEDDDDSVVYVIFLN